MLPRLLLVMTTLLGCAGDKGSGDTAPSGGSDTADADSDGYAADEDCDDGDPQVNPGAAEICDSIDNNCDGSVDEGVTSTFYADQDADGFGADGLSTAACEAPSGYVSVPNDCDDTDGDTFPGAPERCDGADNDCDGAVDEDVQSVWFSDADGDSYGDPDSAYTVCDPPPGYVADDADCDDLNAAAHPGAAEVCDDADNDCDGSVDEGVTTTYYQDADDDSYGLSGVTTEACTRPSGYAGRAGDCDDGDDGISPAQVELCDGFDNNCDGTVDEDAAADAATWYADRDRDGYGNPDDSDVSCGQPSGYVSDDTDCDDSTADANPGAAEVCDSIDNDCDGEADEDSATDAGTWYADSDADGYGSTSSTVACDQPAGFSATGGDCDDGDSDSSPAGTEVCDGADNDCDGDTDEGVTTTWFLDYDSDGYGDSARTTEACSAPGGYTSDDTDCDDTDSSANPGASEVCDEADNDCDGATDEGVTSTFYADDDGDGYGDPGSTDTGCAADSGYVEDDSDCDDTDAAISPEASESCDGIDNDCDGTADNDEDVIGDGEACPGIDCQDILDYRAAAGDGVYWIDPDSTGSSIEVYCDMTTDDGGWTLVMKQASGSGYGSELSVAVWDGWHTAGEVLNEEDASLDDDNMVNEAYSRMTATDLRLTASSTWTDASSGAWTYTVNDTPFEALSDDNGDIVGNLGTTETTPWTSGAFTDASTTTTTDGKSLCWRSGPWFNQVTYEYTNGGVKWGWMFNNECHGTTTDTAEGLGCCGNSDWTRESAWALYLWAR